LIDQAIDDHLRKYKHLFYGQNTFLGEIACIIRLFEGIFYKNFLF